MADSYNEKILQTLRDKYCAIDGVSRLSKNLQFISRYLDTNDVMEHFKNVLDNFGIVDCFDLERGDESLTYWMLEIYKINKESDDLALKAKPLDEAKLKTRLNYMQDHIGELDKERFNLDVRDKLGTALSLLTTDNYVSSQMLNDAYKSVIVEFMDVLRELERKVWSFEPQEKDYEELYENFEKRYLGNRGFFLQVVKDIAKKEEENYGAEIEDYKEWLREAFLKMAASGFFLDKHTHLTTGSVLKVKDEFADFMGGDMDLEKTIARQYALFRKWVGRSGDVFLFGNKRIIGRYIFDNRKELTDEQIESFFRFVVYSHVIRSRMYPENEKVSIEDIKEFDAQALLEYVAQLDTRDGKNNARMKQIWTGLMERYQSIVHEAYGKTVSCFVAGRSEEDKRFSKKFVCCVIGYLKDKYDFYNMKHTAISGSLGEGDKPDNARIKDMQAKLNGYPANVAEIIDNVVSKIED